MFSKIWFIYFATTKLVQGSFTDKIISNQKVLHRVSGFIDVDKIHPDACPAIVADLSTAEQGIIALAFGEFYSDCLKFFRKGCCWAW